MPSKHGKTFLFIIVIFLFAAVWYSQFRVFRGSSTVLSNQPSSEPIRIEDTVLSGTNKDTIPSIDHPKFESIMMADRSLNNDSLGIAVDDRGTGKFYPYQILVWHQAVNDTFAGRDVLVTFNPLTFYGALFSRHAGGHLLTFGVSDRVYNSTILLYDRDTQTLWDSLQRRAIIGELASTTLELIPSTVMSWSEFKSHYPNGRVLSKETGFDRDYTHDPYTSYYGDDRMLFPITHHDDRLFPKTLVYGVKTSDGWVAYRASEVHQNPELKKQLRTQQSELMYWFAWSGVHRETKVVESLSYRVIE